MPVRHAAAGAVVLAIVIAACSGGGTNPTTAPATSAPATAAPETVAPETVAPATAAPATVAPGTDVPATSAPSSIDPGASLDPFQSDAGIVGRVTIPDDTRDERSGTHLIIGREGHGFGTDCAYSFEGTEFIAVAYNDDAQNGQIYQMSVSVPTDSMPANDGEQRAGITNGVAYVDFRSESGFGTAYTGAADRDDGTSTISVTVAGELVFFTFEAMTWDDIAFSGEMVCAGAEL